MYLHTWNPSVYTHFLFDRSFIQCTWNRKFVVLLCKIWQWYHSMNYFTILHEIITARFFDSLIFCYRKMLPYFRNLHHKLPTKHLKLICWILELVHKHKNCSREKPLCCIVTFVYLLTRVESSFVLYRNWWTCLCL